MNNNLNKVKYEEPCDGRLSSTVPREGRGETPRHLLNKKNADIVYGILDKYGLNKRYSRALVSSKWYIKKLLWNTGFDTAKRELWKQTYREINNRILTNSKISVKDKIKFVLTYLHLFPNN